MSSIDGIDNNDRFFDNMSKNVIDVYSTVKSINGKVAFMESEIEKIKTLIDFIIIMEIILLISIIILS